MPKVSSKLVTEPVTNLAVVSSLDLAPSADPSTVTDSLLTSDTYTLQLPVCGKTFPISPSTFTTRPDGSVQPQYPIWVEMYVRCLTAERAGVDFDRTPLITSLLREIVIQTPALRLSGFTGRIVTSMNVPMDSLVVTPDYLIINPFRHKAWDNDGDLLTAAINPDEALIRDKKGTLQPRPSSLAVPIKHPVSWRQDPMELLDPESFKPDVPFNMTATDLDRYLQDPVNFKGLNATREDLFVRAYTVASPAQAYTTVWTAHAWETEGWSLHDRQDHFLRPDYKYQDAHGHEELIPRMYAGMEGLLKELRKSGSDVWKNIEQTTAEFDSGVRLMEQFAMYLTSTKGIGRKSHAQLDWILGTNIHEHIRRVCNLELEYRLPEIIETSNAEPPQHRTYPAELILRMVRTGLIRARELPHASGKPSYLITVHNARGHICGLEGIRQGDTVFGNCWSFILLPVLDTERGDFVDPLVHMNRCSARHETCVWNSEEQHWEWIETPHANGIYGVDDRILNPTTGEVTRLLFAPLLHNPGKFDRVGNDPRGAVNKGWHHDASRYPLKSAKVLEFILQYAGKYGIMVPSHMQPKTNGEGAELAITKIARLYQQNVVIVDHGRPGRELNTEQDVRQLFTRFEHVQAHVGLQLVPFSKGRGHIRKHALALSTDTRYPAWGVEGAKHGADPRRMCMSVMGMLQTASDDTHALRVAIVNPQNLETGAMCDPYQPQITPSGLRKIQTPCFNPRTQSTRPDLFLTIIERQGVYSAWINEVETNHPSLDAALAHVREWGEANPTAWHHTPSVWSEVLVEEFSGGQRLIWIEDGNALYSDTGKLINHIGFKAVFLKNPDQLCAWTGKEWEDVDVLIPATALAEKGMLQYAIRDQNGPNTARYATVKLAKDAHKTRTVVASIPVNSDSATHSTPPAKPQSTGVEFRALVTTMRFVRSSPPNENKRTTYQSSIEVRGMPMHSIASTVRQAQFPRSYWTPSLTPQQTEYVSMLHDLALALDRGLDPTAPLPPEIYEDLTNEFGGFDGLWGKGSEERQG